MLTVMVTATAMVTDDYGDDHEEEEYDVNITRRLPALGVQHTGASEACQADLHQIPASVVGKEQGGEAVDLHPCLGMVLYKRRLPSAPNEDKGIWHRTAALLLLRPSSVHASHLWGSFWGATGGAGGTPAMTKR